MYYRKLYIIVIMLMPVIVVLSQARHDATMVMGYWSNEDFKDPILRFRPDSVHLDYERIALDLDFASCNISGKNGNLLFYFNGCSVANAFHEIIENGTDFNPGKAAKNACRSKSSAYTALHQSSLILPADDKDSLFFLLHLTKNYYQEKDSIIFYGIPRYSILDMKANSGRGRVVLKNQIYHTDTTMNGDGMTAVRHANGRDWWIINHDQGGSNRYYRTLLRDSALIPAGSQNIGQQRSEYGVAGFSSDGSRYFRYSNYNGGLSVMEFDRETGLFSRERYLPVTQENIFAYGGSFSPSGRYVYIGNGQYLMQIDADADVLTADTIAVWDGTAADWGQPAYFGAMQVGPDCRIYMATGYCVPFMHVIMEPDKAGKACDVRQHFFRLDVPVCYVPHFPNYRLGTPYPYCDPDIKVVTSTQQYIPEEPDADPFRLYPNPAYDRCMVTSSRLMHRIAIQDMTGQTVIDENIFPGRIWEADISTLPVGVYIVRVMYSNHQIDTKKLIKIQ
ncbi:MAG: T9SS type A sorting domain-containing protein [Chitinophagales bacterium]|nr:T9SS type A sorting domain-containing protein [Chitinophagales bacterium]